MKMLIYEFIAFIIFYVIGTACIKLLKLKRTRLVNNNPIIPFVFGYIGCVCILELFGLVLPVSITSFIIIAAAFGGFILAFQDIKDNFSQIFHKKLYLILIILLPAMVLSYPQVAKGDIFTAVDSNNDFAYYLSTITWLNNHSILETVHFSHAYSFNSLAEYIINSTRIGTDLTGSFFSCMFSLEAHEAFALLGPIGGMIIGSAVFSAVRYLSGDENVGSLIAGLFASISGTSICLILQNYMPELIGVAFFVLALAAMHELLFENKNGTGIVAGLFVSATLAVYCEYAVYLAFGFIVMLLIALLSRKKIQTRIVLGAFATAILANVYGFYRAIVFNLSILGKLTGNGSGAIDSYGGIMLSPLAKASVITGFGGKIIEAGELWQKILVILLTAVVLINLVIIIKKRKSLSFFIAALLMIILLEAYFIHSKSGYQEYKHLTTMCYLVSVINGVGLDELLERPFKIKKQVTEKLAISLSIVLSIAYNQTAFMRYYNPLFSVGKDTVDELQTMAEVISDAEEITIDESLSPAEGMTALYALKDQPTNYDPDSLAYLPYFQKFDEHKTKYTLYRISELDNLSENQKPVWQNSQYLLVENLDFDGYYRFNITGIGWGSEQNTKVDTETDSLYTNGDSGFALFGPYISLNGKYDFKLVYSVIVSPENSDIGYFDIYDQDLGENSEIAKVPLKKNKNTVEIKNVELDDLKNIECRVYANENAVIKVEGVYYRESVQ